MSTAFFNDGPPFPGAPNLWQFSNNSGGSWANYPGGNLAQVIGPTGTQRFRQQFTVVAPPAAGTVTFSASGDIYANPPNVAARVILDGVDKGPLIPGPGAGSVTFPTSLLTAGPHTIEIWVGQATLAGITRLDAASMNIAFTPTIPCNCCPLELSRCYDTGTTTLVDNQFDSVVLITSSAGATYSLPPTRDGVTATPVVSGIVGSAAGQTVTTSVIDYFYSIPKDNVINVQLWNQGGSDLTDQDGLSNATIVDLFDSDGNVLFSGPLNAGNGGAVFQTPVGNLDGVKRLRLRNISKLNAGATVSPLWREINTQSQNPVPGRAIAMNCNGVITWFDQTTGNQIVVPAPSTSLENKIAFFPSASTDNFGWIETGAPIGGPPQPPNRTLPAPIFNDGGGIYRPHNGAVGRWIIVKNVHSAAAGLGNLTIPAGAFPVDGGIFSDDQARIYVNGVLVPFVGSGTGNIGPQTVPVTWLAGDNILSIEVNNTVAGGTSLAGKLEANTPVQSQFFINCPTSSFVPFQITDLTFAGEAYNSPAEGSPTFDEYIGFSVAPVSTGVGTVLSGSAYHAGATAPISSCGGRVLTADWIGQPVSSITYTYSDNGTGLLVGGVVNQFSSVTMGGPIRFGIFTQGTFLPGQFKDSVPFGGKFVRMTYVSGPTVSGNAPQGETLCGQTQTVGLHRAGASNIDKTIVLRLDFFTV